MRTGYMVVEDFKLLGARTHVVITRCYIAARPFDQRRILAFRQARSGGTIGHRRWPGANGLQDEALALLFLREPDS